jgi:transcription-repair coupling factor (superfamily II helicase)
LKIHNIKSPILFFPANPLLLQPILKQGILTVSEILKIYQGSTKTIQLVNLLKAEEIERVHVAGMVGSQRSFFAASIYQSMRGTHVFVLPDKEIAAYFHNDLESIFVEKDMEYSKRRVLFFPTSYKRPYEIESADSSNVLLRSEVLSKINKPGRGLLVVTYPEALAEKVVDKTTVGKNTLGVKIGDQLSQDFMIDALMEFKFERVDFVVEPGQFAVRGGIIDMFSFSNDYPFRIEFFGDEIESIRTFNPGDQLSLTKLSRISIMPDLHNMEASEQKVSFAASLPKSSSIWLDDLQFAVDRMNLELNKATLTVEKSEQEQPLKDPRQMFIDGNDFFKGIQDFSIVEFGNQRMLDPTFVFEINTRPQPSFNKNFDMLIENLNQNSDDDIKNFIFSGNPKQSERLHSILDDIHLKVGKENSLDFYTINLPIHEGFIDKDLKLACYTDHQIFDRYHRFHLRDSAKGREAITLKEIYNLQPGDYVTHIDHGVGKFDGLETIDNNGREQEAIRLVYDNGDLLYISIHSLHRISKFVGKEGTPPKLNRLGTNTWNRLKERTKKKVKDIAKDLIKLYAQRKSAKGFSFSPDTYLQHELEASFIYEDTPDQNKATVDIKTDLEKDYPMDRLVCGDVGFGKTEVAIRAAFKAVTDGKQVAVLVPTTILALQHYNTFTDRLKDFPVDIEYINRFKSAKQQKEIVEKLERGKIDILIGTHRLVGKDIKFKDLGLLVLDEEQKFGVSVKEKLRQLKVNVDTLTLTATPIPRTMQFSLMGARDLSVINTPPPNRMPIQTEIRGFSAEVISEAINYEVSRNGQVFFVHNRVKNIHDVADMIRKFCPGVTIGIGHGQLEGHQLEKVMLGFINGDFDVLVSTTIVENGLDIPNANTIIINDAQNFGLSEMHQLRGRVGRANKKAFCYLLSPPLSTLSSEARRRLKAIEEFSNLGSGFNIAMRDLDIRGAGNLLGAEQSGFISDIGYEMYNKILDEAMLELRDEEFKGLFKDDVQIEFVKDCQIETDQEILIPKEYVSVTAERVSLYKELDSIETEEALLAYGKRLEDRFGPVPKEVNALFDALRLRWIGKKIGFEKILLKNNLLFGYFITNQESGYFQSKAFNHILDYFKQNQRAVNMRENKGKLSLIFRQVPDVTSAIEKIKPLMLG